MKRAVTGVVHRASRSLGKYRWEAWEGVTVRSCCSWALVRWATGGSAVRVWDLVRHAMVSTSGEVSLGCTLGCGADNWFCYYTVRAGAQGAGSLVNLGVGWVGMGCCVLGCFSILVFTVGKWRGWTGEVNGMEAEGCGVSPYDCQLEEATRRDIMI